MMENFNCRLKQIRSSNGGFPHKDINKIVPIKIQIQILQVFVIIDVDVF